MDFISVFNDVMGPVMRGPSSSHTAGAYRIATVARSLLGEAPASVELAFDPDGSYAPTYEACGVDLASISALLGVPMTDERFCDARELAAAEGVDVQFAVRSLADADHPNYVEIAMTGRTGARLQCAAKSVGGGAIVVSRIEGWPVELTGKAHEVLVECSADCAAAVSDKLTSGAATPEAPQVQARGDRRLVCASLGSPLSSGLRSELAAIPGVERIWAVESVFHVRRGEPIFGSAAEMVELAQARGVSLGRLALEYECELLGLTEADALKEMMARYEVMKRSVQAGLAEQDLRLKLLQPTARRIMEAESQGKTALGGAHTRAAARAMAVMHVSNSMGIVCAAPTGGAAGTIPGVVTTLAAERALSAEQIALSLFAASAIGLIVALRATFAAETAGCQV
ncbi:MAG: L-serine ammonia-lyase, iron-sulfur-dependent, subunit alpha, partial [Armatimonadota bacterium]